MSLPIIGVQLYSLRREFEADAEGTLRKVRGLGYEYIELAGYYGWSAARWKELLDETGLKVAGAHVGEADVTKDLAKTIKFQEAIGNHRYIVGYIPGRAKEDYQKAAKFMNKAAEDLKPHGAELFYHNHDFEFKEIESTTGYDVLLEVTDPELVSFEVDTYWVEMAGMDSLEFVEEHAERIGMIHAKEFRRSDKSDQALGDGDIDFPAILSLAQEHDWPLIVEYEGEGSIDVMRKSGTYLEKLTKSLR